MKTHFVHFDQDIQEYVTLCGVVYKDGMQATLDVEAEMDCLSCDKTNKYKRLKEEAKRKLQDEVKQIGVDIVKDSEPKTYKKTIEIEIEVPIGMEYSNVGQVHELDEYAIGGKFIPIDLELKPKVKSKSELIGVLCYVWNDKSEKRLAIIKQYNENSYVTNREENCNYMIKEGEWWFVNAEPVPLEKLDQLKAKLIGEG